jgi:hypothetical protein
MKDGIIKGTGNSRYLKSALTGINTWEDFRAALLAGTLPIDLNGINEDGWQQIGTALNKAFFLNDNIALKFISTVSGSETINDILSIIGNRFKYWFSRRVFSTTVAGAYSYTVPEGITRLYAIVIGGGGSGCIFHYGDGGSEYGHSGYAGRVKKGFFNVNAGNVINGVIGTGGQAYTVSGRTYTAYVGTAGSTTSLLCSARGVSMIAAGGEGGDYNSIPSSTDTEDRSLNDILNSLEVPTVVLAGRRPAVFLGDVAYSGYRGEAGGGGGQGVTTRGYTYTCSSGAGGSGGVFLYSVADLTK